MDKKFDFSGWATVNDVECSDGRTIKKDAFKGNDGATVPLVWNHQHNEPENVLGHALLKNCDKGVYAYCKFNNTPQGKNAKMLVEHGDITALSIYANQLKQQGGNVIHGNIRELSLVLAGANPSACINTVICHSDNSDEEAIVFSGETGLALSQSDDDYYDLEDDEDYGNDSESEDENDETLSHKACGTSKEEKKKMPENKEKDMKETDNKEKTVQDVIDTMTEEQVAVMYALIEQAIADAEKGSNKEGGNSEDMKHNVFDNDNNNMESVLSHADKDAILSSAKTKSVGSLKEAMQAYIENDEHLAHGINDIETLFPEFKDVKPGAPELLTNDQGWVEHVMSVVHKAPYARVRTRQADARAKNIRGLGYVKAGEKKLTEKINLLKRTTDPQTIYIKDALNRDDILDITDFDVVEYNYGVMRMGLNEEIATAIMLGDGRSAEDPDKIQETHIRPVWTDDELYTIHADIDVEKAKAELQGTNTAANFGENYIFAEAFITAALYAREKYKGKGGLDMYCTPHTLNVMLLARDLNGRRIYSSVADLKAALNVNNIFTAEQFEGKVRTTESGKKKLAAIFVNLAQDYQVGSVKGGEITKFDQFDIDFNQQKMLLETRLSGAMINPLSAIVLEEKVSE